ncbi:MAG: ferrous iron transport protein B [Oscillospiraceae bacterium]|nr:ferrous iron transport protein B [Oscillospiraceae bacterium]
MSLKIALAGNPNCGKTTMFNALTGSSQYVGNWPGVTVEKKEGRLKGFKDITIVDLPGIYSLSPYTLEEVVTRNFLINEKPDAIINIIDASNLERNLYLTTQLLETGIPMVIALNMMDIVKKRGDKIDVKKLSEELGCEIIETSALKNEGSFDAAKKAIEAASHEFSPKKIFSGEIQKALAEIENIYPTKENPYWFSLKLFERDPKVLEQLNIPAEKKAEIEKKISVCEESLDDDSESIITNERYNYISGIISSCLKKKGSGMTASDRIDMIVTNRILALPIFAAVMFLVYYISVSTLGTVLTDFVNDTIFGNLTEWLRGTLESLGTADWMTGLVVDGIVAGVGAVLGFVPQIMLLFFFLSILEDCGYMARVAFIMDRIFRKFGLSGKSFIPMLISSGCGVPGIMASRTIEQERDRKMTIMLTTFIPCSAKIPIIALMAGALFGGKAWVAPSVYFLGVAMIIICGIILKQTNLFKGDPAPFVMELPQYHIPSAKGVLIHMWDRGKSFIIKAGTVIFAACGIIWFLSSFGWQDGSFGMVEGDGSILAKFGSVLAPLFIPLGFGNWQSVAASISGLVAKENVLATFGILFNVSGEATEENAELLSNVAAMFTPVSAYAFIAFNMLCAPCFAAIGAIRREMGSAKWTLITISFQTGVAYIVALLINQIGSFFLGNGSILGAVISVLVAALAVSVPIIAAKRNLKPAAVKV